MQAIKRIFITNDWVTLLFIIGLGLLFVMKLYQPKRLSGYSLAFFVKGFIAKRAEENPNFFNPFHGVLFLFNTLVLSLFLSFLFFDKQELSFTNFSTVFTVWLFYVAFRFVTDILLENLFGLTQVTRYFRFSKIGYLYSLSLLLFPVLIFYFYSFNSKQFLIVVFILLFLTRMLLIANNNKKLIFSYFFYFILYICTLEIAPLFLLYKTITT